jgi:sporulation protein YlmC with PRC-barrel domain
MSAGRVPEDRTSGLTGGPQPRADGPGTDPAVDAAASADVASGRRPPRLQALAGLTVRGSDGRTVGRVRDIYQQDASGALAAITVMPRQLSARTVLIPAAALEELPMLTAQRDGARPSTSSEEGSGAGTGRRPGEDPVVRLRVDAATVRAGARPPEIAHVTPQDLREAAEALGLEPDEPAPSRPEAGRG